MAHSLAFILFLLPLHSRSEFEEGSEQGSAVIVHQLDQSGLLHQSAQLNQVSGARAPVLHPLAGVITGTVSIEAVMKYGQAL